MAFNKDNLAKDDLGVGIFRVPGQKSYADGLREGYKKGVDSGTKITIDGEQVTTLAIDDFVEEATLECKRELKNKADVSDIEYLAKKINNIQEGFAEEMFVVDDSIAITKIAPENSSSYAMIDQIGGSLSAKNLFNLKAVAEDLGMETDGDSITISGQVSTTKTLGELFPNLVVGRYYTLSYESEMEQITYYNPMTTITFGYNMPADTQQPKVFFITENDINSPVIFMAQEMEYNETLGYEDYAPRQGTFTNIMLNEGGYVEVTYQPEYDYWLYNTSNMHPEPLPYVEYVQSNNKVTEIKVEGKDFFAGQAISDAGILNFDPLEDGSIHIYGTAKGEWRPLLLYNNLELPLGIYIMRYSIINNNGGKNPELSFYGQDEENGEWFNGSLTSSDQTITLPYGKWTITGELVYNMGDTFDCIIYPSLTNPTKTTIFPVPIEVQSLPGYGLSSSTNSNRIKWTDSGRALYLQELGEDGAMLENPVETDVSEYFPWENLIPVEGGGTISIITDTGEPVPSTIIFQKRGV